MAEQSANIKPSIASGKQDDYPNRVFGNYYDEFLGNPIVGFQRNQSASLFFIVCAIQTGRIFTGSASRKNQAYNANSRKNTNIHYSSHDSPQ
jgi:hypothetical protein